MNILSSPIWPDEIPNDAWVYLVIRMMQISEEGMNQQDEAELQEAIKKGTAAWKDVPSSFIEDLRGGADEGMDKDAEILRLNFGWQKANAELRESSEEVERLNALVSMQAELLRPFANFQCDDDTCKHNNCEAYRAITKTAKTVSAWQSKRDAEIRAKALEDAADWFVFYGPPDTPIEADDAAARELRRMASELRAKGE